MGLLHLLFVEKKPGLVSLAWLKWGDGGGQQNVH